MGLDEILLCCRAELSSRGEKCGGGGADVKEWQWWFRIYASCLHQRLRKASKAAFNAGGTRWRGNGEMFGVFGNGVPRFQTRRRVQFSGEVQSFKKEEFPVGTEDTKEEVDEEAAGWFPVACGEWLKELSGDLEPFALWKRETLLCTDGKLGRGNRINLQMRRRKWSISSMTRRKICKYSKKRSQMLEETLWRAHTNCLDHTHEASSHPRLCLSWRWRCISSGGLSRVTITSPSLLHHGPPLVINEA